MATQSLDLLAQLTRTAPQGSLWAAAALPSLHTLLTHPASTRAAAQALVPAFNAVVEAEEGARTRSPPAAAGQAAAPGSWRQLLPEDPATPSAALPEAVQPRGQHGQPEHGQPELQLQQPLAGAPAGGTDPPAPPAACVPPARASVCASLARVQRSREELQQQRLALQRAQQQVEAAAAAQQQEEQQLQAALAHAESQQQREELSLQLEVAVGGWRQQQQRLQVGQTG